MTNEVSGDTPSFLIPYSCTERRAKGPGSTHRIQSQDDSSCEFSGQLENNRAYNAKVIFNEKTHRHFREGLRTGKVEYNPHNKDLLDVGQLAEFDVVLSAYNLIAKPDNTIRRETWISRSLFEAKLHEELILTGILILTRSWISSALGLLCTA